MENIKKQIDKIKKKQPTKINVKTVNFAWMR